MQAELTNLTSAPPSRAWPLALAAIAAGFAILVAVFWGTASSAVDLWSNSSAYNYAFLIAPISAYLIWEVRDELARMTPQPTIWGAGVLAACGLVWALAASLEIAEGQHFAFVGMMQGLFLGVLGLAIYRRISFALLYLFLMVPTGAFLIEPLQYIGFYGAVFLLQLSGIPVYAEGLTIQIPEGNFHVAEGCAGLNFLLTALALSLLYGKLAYRKMSTRVACVVIALAVSIIANIVRIYLIVAGTQWSDSKLDIADDHLLYGWGFFAVITLVAIWLGAKVKEEN